jgi:surfactin synthase thioesterase subunit
VRADLALLASYRCAPEAPLPCPITVLGGIDDPDTDDRTLEAWRELSSGRFERRMFPGGHFFVGEEREAILRLIADRS